MRACDTRSVCAAVVPDDTATFAQRLLALLDEGRRTATYKLATLLSLLDCCVSESDASGRAPEAIPIRGLAERVVALYWPQTRPYRSSAGSVRLRQSTQPKATTPDAVAALRVQAEAAGATSLHTAAVRVPDAYERCLKQSS